MHTPCVNLYLVLTEAEVELALNNQWFYAQKPMDLPHVGNRSAFPATHGGD